MNSSTKPGEHFVAEGGIAAPVNSDKDPFEVLDDLMVVVETLCPVWPLRDTVEKARNFRL